MKKSYIYGMQITWKFASERNTYIVIGIVIIDGTPVMKEEYIDYPTNSHLVSQAQERIIERFNGAV